MGCSWYVCWYQAVYNNFINLRFVRLLFQGTSRRVCMRIYRELVRILVHGLIILWKVIIKLVESEMSIVALLISSSTHVLTVLIRDFFSKKGQFTFFFEENDWNDTDHEKNKNYVWAHPRLAHLDVYRRFQRAGPFARRPWKLFYYIFLFYNFTEIYLRS